MARTVAVIEQQIYDQIALRPKLAAIVPNPSQVSNWKTFIHCIAVCIAVLEQLIDLFKSDVEATVAAAPPGSEPWVFDKVGEFQYDAITPQVLQLVNVVPAYNPVDITKRIISRRSVKTAPNNVVFVNVATGEPPVALSGPQVTALQSYLTNGGDGTFAGRGRGLGFAGIDYVVRSLISDKLYLAGTIYFNGQYSATIVSLVLAAINSYIANLPFNGSISLLGITDAIQSVPAVNDILLTDVAVRANATGFGSKTYMRQNKTDIIPIYPTYAGYIVEETTSGETFTDKLVFVTS